MGTAITHGDDAAYPPEPWRLAGTLHASVWLVPRRDLPASLPDGTRPISWRGRRVVLTAWAVYTSEGMLAYDEMMCMTAVRAALRPAVSITHIWVDSPSSAAGGRALWGIPKRLGEFRRGAGEEFAAELSEQSGPVASFEFAPGWSLPGRRRIAIRTAQMLKGRLKVTKARASGRLGFGQGRWRFSESGPLHFLNGHDPLFSVRLNRMTVSFGG